MSDNPFDQFDSAPVAPAQSGSSNPFDQFDAGPPATRAQPQNPELSGSAPIVISALRPQGQAPVKSQEVNPTTTVAGFDVQPDYTPHSSLTADQKAQYASFFKDPKNPPSAAALQTWYKAQTGADLGDAQQIVDYFRRTGKFSTHEQINIPAKHQSGVAAGINHAANATVGDYGAEVGGAIDSLTKGGSWANNADLEHAQLSQDSTDHPYWSAGGELVGAALTAPITADAGAAIDAGRVGEVGRGIIQGAGEGALYGSGAAGPGNRLEGAAGGASLGALAGAALTLPAVKASSMGNPAAQEAAARVNSDLETNFQPTIANSTSSKTGQALRSGSDASLVGGALIGADGRRFVGNMDNARQAITDKIAPGVSEPDLGSAVSAATDSTGSNNLLDFVKRDSDRGGTLYDSAQKLTGNPAIASPRTVAFLDSQIQRLSQAGDGPAVQAALNKLQSEREFFGQLQSLKGLRDHRTMELSDAFDGDNSLLNGALKKTWGLSGEDIDSGLRAGGLKDGADAFRAADADWQSSVPVRNFIKRLVDPNKATPDSVTSSIMSMTRNDGYKLARVLQAAPNQAPEVRAAIVDDLFKAPAGSPIAGTTSPDVFATNWGKLPDSVKTLYAPEVRQSLDDLATLAQANKNARSLGNNSKTALAANILRVIAKAGDWVAGASAAGATPMGHAAAVALSIPSLKVAAATAATSAALGKFLTSPRAARTLAQIAQTGRLGPGLARLRVLTARLSGEQGKGVGEFIINELSGSGSSQPSTNGGNAPVYPKGYVPPEKIKPIDVGSDMSAQAADAQRQIQALSQASDGADQAAAQQMQSPEQQPDYSSYYDR